MTSSRKPSGTRLIVGVIFVLGLALLLVAILAASGTTAWLEGVGAMVLLVASYWLSVSSRKVLYRRLRQHEPTPTARR